jgi:chaperonin cofactor prefoldin
MSWNPLKIRRLVTELRESLDAWKLQVKNLSSMVRERDEELELLRGIMIRATRPTSYDEPRMESKTWIR